jgi:hypothetical protein
MKIKFVFSLVFLFFFLFLARGGWLPTDIRLDTGDTPGANDSWGANISSSGSNVYAVWTDYRNGEPDIYFNYSTDDGLTWQVTDIRLDTGDTPGANSSRGCWVSSSASNVYVAWRDSRNGKDDIYFNYSTDYGETWQTMDIRLDTGDTPGASDSWWLRIDSNDSNVYVVWCDHRNGERDIYLNYSADGGTTWQASDIRLDTGDTPGTNDSKFPVMSSSGSNVYVTWQDYRNGSTDIYFNYSTDYGATWEASDIRLDIGDTPGTHGSEAPWISCTGSNVYVVWSDTRNGASDIYFNYSTDGGATWQASDIRLDTGEMPGTNDSYWQLVSSEGNNIYVVWMDERNGNTDIYFNYSTDGGATWKASDIRLDKGDTPGANDSASPWLTCSGLNVYVVWEDYRNGEKDIYFNCSTDGGRTWKTPDVRLDTGDVPGAFRSSFPKISSFENSVYVVWYDFRNGEADIYFNTTAIPATDIKANGSDGPITIARSNTLSITVEFDAGTYSGDDADWWLLASTPLGWYYYDKSAGWLPGREVTLQIPLRDLPLREVLNMSGLPAGDYMFYFGVDLVKNGLINMGQAYYDSVKVTVTP